MASVARPALLELARDRCLLAHPLVPAARPQQPHQPARLHLYRPVLTKPEAGDGAALGELSRRSRPWLYISLLVFILTGVYLLLVDSNYLGIGNFSNPWAVLMLVKHIVVVAIIALGFWFNAVKRVGQNVCSVPGDAQRRARFRRYIDMMTLCGVLVLILTAFAQIE